MIFKNVKQIEIDNMDFEKHIVTNPDGTMDVYCFKDLPVKSDPAVFSSNRTTEKTAIQEEIIMEVTHG